MCIKNLKEYLIKERVKYILFNSIPRRMRSLIMFKISKISIYALDFNSPETQKQIETHHKIGKSLEGTIQIKVLSKEDRTYFDKYLNFRSDFLPKELLENILNKDCFVFLALKNNEILAAMCGATKKMPLFTFGLDFILQKNQCYGFHYYVSPENRNGKLAIFLIGHIKEYYKKSNFEYFICAAYEQEGVNKSLKYGFTKVGNVVFFEISLLKWHYVIKNKHPIKTRVRLLLLNKRTVEL